MHLTRIVIMAALTLAAVAARLMPHPANLDPVGPLALFAGAYFADRRLALIPPLVAMVICDLFIGFHVLVPFVYGSYALTVLLGFGLRGRRRLGPIAGMSLASALLFFAVTNFGCWLLYYPWTPRGFVLCFLAALPFLPNTLSSYAVYGTLLFGGQALVERWLLPAAQPNAC